MKNDAIDAIRKALAARDAFRKQYPCTKFRGCDQDDEITILLKHIDRLTNGLDMIGQGFSVDARIQSNAAKLVLNGWDLKDSSTVVASGKNP